MKQSIIDVSGQRFGRLIAVELVRLSGSARRVWRCMCDCGNECFVQGRALRAGIKKSCGCLRGRNKFYEIDGTGLCLMANGGYFWFSLDDSDFITSRQWYADVEGYAFTTENKTTKRLTRLLCGLAPGDSHCVDHINGDVCDNRRCNLRVCTVAQNARHTNRKVKGYSKDAKGGYLARLKSDGTTYYLGRHRTPEAARAAYLNARDKLHGEFTSYKRIVWFPGCEAGGIKMLDNR